MNGCYWGYIVMSASANFVFSCSWLHRSVKTSEANWRKSILTVQTYADLCSHWRHLKFTRFADVATTECYIVMSGCYWVLYNYEWLLLSAVNQIPFAIMLYCYAALHSPSKCIHDLLMHCNSILVVYCICLFIHSSTCPLSQLSLHIAQGSKFDLC